MDAGKRARRGKSETDGDRTMTRSEERLNVGTEQVETGHVRLRKYVVTEEQQVTVPVRHEEVRIEREPIKDGQRGARDRRGRAGPHPARREARGAARKPCRSSGCACGTETVTDEQTVSGKVRKEQFEVTDDEGKHRR